MLADSLSTTGFIFTLAGPDFCWKKKQFIANPIMEAELIALTLATQEAKWLRDFLYQTPLCDKQFHLCDCTTAIDMVKNRYYNGKSDA